jgi:hypothetical protein
VHSRHFYSHEVSNRWLRDLPTRIGGCDREATVACCLLYRRPSCRLYSRKARDASRRGQGEQKFAVQRLQDVRERSLHDPTIGEWASTRRFEKEISPASEWWGEDVVFQIVNVRSRDRAPSGHATIQGMGFDWSALLDAGNTLSRSVQLDRRSATLYI